MVHRDLKIGLVLGLIIVIGIVIKLATDPHLSPQARMMELNGSQNKTDTNNVSQNYLASDISLDSIQSESPDSSALDVLRSASEKPESGTQIENNSDPPNFFGEPEETLANPYPPNEQTEPPEIFDYENAEKIKTERFYIVGKNQTLSQISRLYYGSANQWQKIVDANPQIKDPNKIKPGMKLIIPWED